jgi:tRNA-specific 2-thiouridylase
LPASSKSESQEICFIPDGDYASYIENRHGKVPRGYYINNEGKILGEHEGIIRYTVGQRKGLGIALGERVFVTAVNPRDNTVTLSNVDEKRNELYIEGILFSSVPEMKDAQTREYSVKLRYLQKPVSCLLTYLGGGRGRVVLREPVRAVTPGQSAVFYEGERLALGAFISNFN